MSRHFRNFYHVGETAVAKQVEGEGSPVHLSLEAGEASADEGEPTRECLDHLADNALVVEGDCDLKLAAGRCPIGLKGP